MARKKKLEEASEISENSEMDEDVIVKKVVVKENKEIKKES